MPPAVFNTWSGRVFQKKTTTKTRHFYCGTNSKTTTTTTGILFVALLLLLCSSCHVQAADPFGTSSGILRLLPYNSRRHEQQQQPSSSSRRNLQTNHQSRHGISRRSFSLFPWTTTNRTTQQQQQQQRYHKMRECAESQTCLADQMRGGHMEHASNVMDTPYGLPLNVWKVLFQAALTAINVACWLIPLRSKQVVDNPLALSLANAFSGGVFLALALGHLIPECLHGFPADWNETAPFYLVLAGYLLIFFVEKVAFDAHDILHEMQSGGGGDHHHRHSHGHGKEKTVAATTNGDANTAASTGRSAIILLGALGVHSILEMMALGLADTFRDGALLTASIALHQPAESIALLVAFLKSGLTHQEILTYLSIFSCMGPIGVALGMAVNEYAAPVVDAAMLAVVAGTFVYVGATEVIPEEWEDSKHKWKKFAALMTGIISIAGITQYTMSLGGGHDHSHAHG